MVRRGRLPTSCPSCSGDLRVARLVCPECGTAVKGDYPLPALSRLGSEDQQFALAFILRSGSLKEMAKLYGVSYPTVRNRLDDVIARLSAIIESPETDAAGERVLAGTDATSDGADATREDDDSAGARVHGGGGHTDAAGSDE